MATELAIFTDEGYADGPFYSKAEAAEALAGEWAEDGWIAEVCPDHRDEFEKDCCPDCDQ